jgi:deazaflavin-dependent oxidoreductase (nitroreductase family)
MSDADLRKALKDAREVELTVTGRKSGEESSRPVWFTEEGNRIYLLPVGGSEANWFKNLLLAPRIRLTAEGAELETEAKPITDAAAVNDVLERFSEKYGDSPVREYYPDQDVAVEVTLAGAVGDG